MEFVTQNRSTRVNAIMVLMLLSVVTVNNVSAQDPTASEFAKSVDFLPPPPNAAAIAKATLFSLNKNTGSPNINVPLFTVKGRKLSLDIGLTYSTYGIKVDEIASRVGMGWSLKAGGVISRVVRGAPDENLQRAYPWAPVAKNWSTYNYMVKTVNSNNYVGHDTEPDMFSFSFNGYGGSFVFDELMNVVQVPAGNFKIEKDFSSTASWNFKITTPDGIMYFFGGSSATEKTKRDQICAKSFNDYIATAWYLTKVKHPGGEEIILNYQSLNYSYETGISESMHLRTTTTEIQGGCSGVEEVDFNSTSCINYTSTQGCALISIVSQVASAYFTYTTRTDCNDALISTIQSNNKVGGISLLKEFKLLYNTINTVPYLHIIQEYSSDLSSHIDHFFQYNDPAARPQRLSKSQDHWGFYNGKNNTTLIPKVDLSNNQLAYYFSDATADRSPDFNYASKGILNKIIYPTGGIDSILYEPHGSGFAGNPKMEWGCEVSGLNTKDIRSKSFSFSLSNSQTVNLEVEVICTDTYCDNLHQFGKIVISGSNYDQLFSLGTNQSVQISLLAGNYTLQVIAAGATTTTKAKISYKGPLAQGRSELKNIGPGVRVKAFLSGIKDEIPQYKRFYYGDLQDLNSSTGSGAFTPVYVQNYTSVNGNVEQQASTMVLARCYSENKILYSNSLRSLYVNSSDLYSYASVVESNGEDFEGGGIVTEFMTGKDQLGVAVWGNDIQSSQFTNWSITYNGKIKKETVYKRAVDGSLIAIKQTDYVYKSDPRGYKSVKGYTVFKKGQINYSSDTTCTSTTINSGSNYSCDLLLTTSLEIFDMMEYTVFAPWVYLDTLKETVYDEMGQNPLTTFTKYYYDNEFHQLPTKVETYNSKNEQLLTENSYSHDQLGNGTVYTSMVNQHLLSPVITSTFKRAGNTIANTITNFTDLGNNLILPTSFEKSYIGQSLDLEGTINYYDGFGNITEYVGRDGVVNSIVWGYDYLYPVAKIAGATYQQVIAQLSTSVTSIQSLTGSALRQVFASLRTSLPGAFITSYTYLPHVGTESTTNENNLTTYYEYDSHGRLILVRNNNNEILNKYSYSYTDVELLPVFKLYFNDEVTGVFNTNVCPYGTTAYGYGYTIPAGKFFSTKSKDRANELADAELQLAGQDLADAYSTCTNMVACPPNYKKIGCECIAGSRVYTASVPNGDGTCTNTYHLRWPDGSVSATSYTETNGDCWTIYQNVQKSATFQKNDCPSGYAPTNVTYTVDAGSYSSMISQADADAKAQNDVNQNGQLYANNNGACILICTTSNCTGEANKCINNNCQTGVKVYTNSVQVHGSLWECTYHYEWSDGSWSQNYVEYSSSICMTAQ